MQELGISKKKKNGESESENDNVKFLKESEKGKFSKIGQCVFFVSGSRINVPTVSNKYINLANRK